MSTLAQSNRKEDDWPKKCGISVSVNLGEFLLLILAPPHYVHYQRTSWVSLGFSQVILDTFAFWYRRWSETANLNILDLVQAKIV